MPKKKSQKPVTEMTTEELAQRVFPKPVLKYLKEIAHKGEKKDDPDSSHK